MDPVRGLNLGVNKEKHKNEMKEHPVSPVLLSHKASGLLAMITAVTMMQQYLTNKKAALPKQPFIEIEHCRAETVPLAKVRGVNAS